MRNGRRVVAWIALISIALGASEAASAQAQQTGKKKKEKFSADTTPYVPTALFAASDPLPVTLTLNVRQIKRDRGDNPPWRAASMSFSGADAKPVEMPVRVQTRGIWRRKNCDIPPIRLDLTKNKVKKTVFEGQNHLKLTIPCHINDNYEQFLLQEFNLYRVYNALTPISHRARLIRLTVVDSASSKPELTRYAFVTESETELASRNRGHVYDVQGAGSDDLEAPQSAIMSLFEYLIGNTDYSVAALHNVELMARDTSVYPIAYDFDFSGAVHTPYATTDPRLSIKRVTDRLYRGPCPPARFFPPAVELFNARREAITALYHDDIGRLIEPGRVKETLEFFDDFYKTIDDQRQLKREILEVCSSMRGG